MQNDIIRKPKASEDVLDPAPPTKTPSTETIQDIATEASHEKHPLAVHNKDKQDVADPAPAHPKSTKPIGIIVTAVIICAGLIGAAIFMGTQTDKSASTSENIQPATVAADDTVQEIDGAIGDTASLEDAIPDLSAELSDQSLGL